MDSCASCRLSSSHDPEEGRLRHLWQLLLFGAKTEYDLPLTAGGTETVWVLFAGDSEQPLLVQRIGKAREAAAAASMPLVMRDGSSGADAVPSLGFVPRGRGADVKQVREAAEAEARAAGLEEPEILKVGAQAERDCEVRASAKAAL